MFPDFMTTAQDGGKVVSLTHRPPLPPGNAPGTHFGLNTYRSAKRNEFLDTSILHVVQPDQINVRVPLFLKHNRIVSS